MKHLLAEMTCVEFAERLPDGPVILLPLGSQEEQGPHAPMGDYMLTERLAGMVAERAGAIAAPIMPFGYAEYFRAVPGGIAVRAATFCAVLEDMADAFLAHGLPHLVILNGHTGNAALIDQTTRKLRRERGVIIPALHIWQLLPPAEWTRLHGADAARARGHGADPLTSVYRHLFPALMRDDLAAPGEPIAAFGMRASGPGGAMFEDGAISLPLNVTDVTRNGVISGDPTLSSAAIGAEMVDWLAAYIARFVVHFRGCDPERPDAGVGAA